MEQQINLKELSKFLVRAKKATYAGEGREVAPERPGFKELEYKEGIWSYRDSYTGFYSAPGQEIVRLNDKPVWAMAYSGGMMPGFSDDLNLAKETFSFLKDMLKEVEEWAPFRGSVGFRSVSEGKWIYENELPRGADIRDFIGREKIRYHNNLVFAQDYIGGIIRSK